jgi:pyruvate dehydrogenase E2 component (dihydrolipoamide acetyltransferase)
MATPVIMPRQGQSVESCIIGKWHKQVGDTVKAGDILFTYETDKATFDEAAQQDGVLLATFFAEGDDVPCLTNVCVIGQPGESFAEFDPRGGTAEAAPAPVAAAQPAAAAPVPAATQKAAAPVVSGPQGTPVIMPRQGQSVESCIIGKWHKQVGDPVKAGDVLFTYETDKATFDEPSKVDGTMLAIFFAEGDDVPCLTNVCVVGQPGDSFAQFDPNGGSAGAAQAAAPTSSEGSVISEAISAAAVTAVPTVSGTGTLPEAISPRARNLADRSNADLRQAQGSGPHGRVIERDVLDLIASGKTATSAAGTAYDVSLAGTGLGGRVSVRDLAGEPAAAPVAAAPVAVAAPAAAAAPAATPAPAPAAIAAAAAGPESYTEKHSNIRKVIARSMQASLSQMAQLTLNTSFDVSDILALRARLKKAGENGLKAEQGFALAEKVPTLNDIILYACSRVLKRHASCNAHYDDEKMTFFNRVHLGVACDTPRGLMVPTIFNADLMGLATLSAEVKSAVADCQKGTISPDRLKGGTFTVTNLGTMDIESFTPVINPPQTCILGVDTITTRVREVNGELKGYPAMGLSLTFDHRALDGAPAARFLKDLKLALENFSLLLME